MRPVSLASVMVALAMGCGPSTTQDAPVPIVTTQPQAPSPLVRHPTAPSATATETPHAKDTGMDEGVLVASWQLGPGIALGPRHLYWTEAAGAGAVRRVPLGGGKPAMLWGGKQTAWDIVWHEGRVYFSRAIFGRSALGEVLRIEDGGGAATTVASGLNGPTALAVDDEGVYFSTRHDIRFARHDGSPEVVLVRGGKNIAEIAAAHSFLYWIDDGKLQRIARNAKVPQRIAQLGSNMVSNLVIDDTHVYFFEFRAGAIMRVVQDGTAPPQQFVDTAGASVEQLAQDQASIFWTTSKVRQAVCCHVMRADKIGGTPQVVAKAELVSALAVNDRHVFYLTHGSNVAIVKKLKGDPSNHTKGARATK